MATSKKSKDDRIDLRTVIDPRFFREYEKEDIRHSSHHLFYRKIQDILKDGIEIALDNSFNLSEHCGVIAVPWKKILVERLETARGNVVVMIAKQIDVINYLHDVIDLSKAGPVFTNKRELHYSSVMVTRFPVVAFDDKQTWAGHFHFFIPSKEERTQIEWTCYGCNEIDPLSPPLTSHSL